MRVPVFGLLSALVALVVGADSAQACNLCKKPACSGRPACVYVAPQPAYRCVTEMVPYTVTQTRMKMELKPQSFTVMAPVAETTWVERTCMVTRPVIDSRPVQRRYTVCRPVQDTQYVPRTVNVCRLVPETTYVDQAYTVCRPVVSSRLVTDYAMQATTQVVAVPVERRVAAGCGGCGLGVLCGKKHGLHGCNGLTPTGCQYVAQTTCTPVPVTRTVTETHMVPETAVRQVPVTTCRWVRETKTEMVAVTTCRWVREEKIETTNVMCCRIETVPEVRKFPVMTIKCVPQERTRLVPVCVPEIVETTCYKPVTRMVPVCPPAAVGGSVILPAPAPAVVPASQLPSTQAKTDAKTKPAGKDKKVAVKKPAVDTEDETIPTDETLAANDTDAQPAE